MSFFGFVLRNVLTRKARVLLTAIAIAVSIMTVVTMGVLTHSLKKTATQIQDTAEADFSIAQKGADDLLTSSIDQDRLDEISTYAGIDTVIGVFIAPVDLDDDHPFFLQIGIEPEQFDVFGVHVIVGKVFDPRADDQVMLGYKAARDLGKTIGDTMVLDQAIDDPDKLPDHVPQEYTVVGIFRIGESGNTPADSAAMLPLITLQANERRPNTVTLGFVRVAEGADIGGLRDRIQAEFPELTTAQTAEEFGGLDRNLRLISAANAGILWLALIIGGITVMNTMTLTVFERTREFGILRAVGWPRWRILVEVMSEAIAISLGAAVVGIGLGFGMVKFVEQLPELSGVFEPDYPSGVFGRALGLAFGMAFIGALWPAIRAALLQPLAAIRHD
jgi:putative ABC transport system permease protein